MKKGLFLLLAIVLGLPLGHLAYERLPLADADRESAAWKSRVDVLSRASVFLPGGAGATPISESELECRYEPEETSGTTPKFDCTLPDGEVVKVKYGENPEIAGEIAATRLLAALGFAADDMRIVARVRCYGCPRSPYRSRQVAEWFFVASVLDRFLDYSKYADFANAAVERKFPARSIEVGEHKGFGFYELDVVDPARGGASRADVDAFRLAAVLLAHWDNKASNQRLICLGDTSHDGPGPCARPMLMMQDLGATFGPKKVTLEAWKKSPIWRDAEGCMVSMRHLPYAGATFADVQISEQGRALLAARLARFTREDLTGLLRSSRFPDAKTGKAGAEDVSPWVDALQQKIEAIVNRACGPSPSR
ncbi:MAG: hypothetical protein M3Q55_11855 [Acidobacteriota bacterium]|nr:hypothetical protein [Acidobacteriota bacterium]